VRQLSAETKIKQEARARLRNNNWGKAVAITVILLCIPFIQSLCNEFAAYLFGVNLNVVPQDWDQIIPWIMRRISNWPYFLMLGAGCLIFWLLSAPLSLGAVRWNLRASQGGSPPVEELFYYFANRKRFFRSLGCSIQLLLRGILWFVVCLGPGIALAIVCSVMGNLAHTSVGNAPLWAVVGMLSAALLIPAGLVCFFLLMLRYFSAQTAVAALESTRVSRCISLSVRRIKGKKRSAFLLVLSFAGWGLLCFFVLPALFVVPYFRMSRVTCSKWILIEDIKEEYQREHPQLEERPDEQTV
jgi:uncharacterized membrane protein